MSEQYGVREAWEGFLAGLDTTPEGTSEAALTKWAEAPVEGLDRNARELLVSSVAGAVLVDRAIDKLAYSPEEVAFLKELNAEAGLRDLARLSKHAGWQDFFKSPVVRGMGIGTAVGAGIGAWKDDDNRLRGAALGAVPGAALGALGGHLYQGYQKHVGDLAGMSSEAETQKLKETLEANRQKLKAQEAAKRELENETRRKADVEAAAQRFKTQKQEHAEKFHGSILDAIGELQDHAVVSGDDHQHAVLQEMYARLTDPGLKATFIQHAAENGGHAVHTDVQRSMFTPGYEGLREKVLQRAKTLLQHADIRPPRG